MILVISWPQDDHALAVLRELAALGQEATLIDLARFPQHLRLVARYGAGGRRYRLVDDGRHIDLDRCAAIWWRRPQPFTLHPEIAEGPHASFAYTEASEALAGTWPSLETTWINDPVRDEVAGHKVYQLRVAQEVGLEIPETLVTNDPAEVRAFIEARGEGALAYKAFLPSPVEWRETRVLRRDEMAQLDAVRYAPVIFQEYVPGPLDLRVTVIGDEMLASAIHSAQTAYRADYRMDLGRARVEPFHIPADVEARLRALMDRLGLVYGAIDMRLRPDGRHVFLEVNPGGQWLFVEERTGQPITATFARMLAARVAVAGGRT